MFGRRKRSAGENPEPDEEDWVDTDVDDYADAEDYDAEDTYDELEEAEPEQAADSYGETGPFDLAEAPDDEVPRIDLGCVRVPVPDGAQLQVEMDPEDNGIRAVHLLTAAGQFTMNAYAAPRSGGLWPEVATELAEQLRSDGASVDRVDGEWGEELVGAVNDVALRFIGVDGPRWLLRGVVAGPREFADDSARELTEIVRDTIVVRGDSPMPVRTPLPMELPAEIAEQVQQAQEA